MAEKKEQWITVKGNHILVKEGQTAEEAVKERFESKGEDTKTNDKGYKVSKEYKGYIQFENDKESMGYPRKIHKDLDYAIERCRKKKEEQREVDKINKKATPLRHSPVVVENPLGDGYIVATRGLTEKHGLTEVFPVDRRKKTSNNSLYIPQSKSLELGNNF